MIKCPDCEKEYTSKEKKCPNCGRLTKYNKKTNPLKMILITIIPLIIMLLLSLSPLYIKQSNKYDADLNQLEINISYINIRRDSNLYSAILGKAKYGEIYTILDEENGWYKIKTNTHITGWIYGANENVKLLNESSTSKKTTETKTTKEEEKVDTRTSKEKLHDALLSQGYKTSDNIKYTYYYSYDGTTFMNTVDLNEKEFTKYVESTNDMYMAYVTIYNYSTNKVHYEMSAKVYSISSWMKIDWNVTTTQFTWSSNLHDEDYATETVNSTLTDTYNEFMEIINDNNINIDEL